MNIAVVTGASSGLVVKFLEAVMTRYPDLDEYWIIARRKERLQELAAKHAEKKIIAIDHEFVQDIYLVQFLAGVGLHAILFFLASFRLNLDLKF